MKIIERINLFISESGLSKNAFDRRIGAGNNYIGKQIKNNASIGSDVVQKIIAEFPKLSPDWLLLGRGPMLRGDLDTQVSHARGELAAIEKNDKEMQERLFNAIDTLNNLSKQNQELLEERASLLTERKELGTLIAQLRKQIAGQG